MENPNEVQLINMDVHNTNVESHEEQLINNMGVNNNNNVESGDAHADKVETRDFKKKKHRLNEHQLRRLEESYSKFIYPDEDQQKELSDVVGLKPHQVKFWFQNKRTQMKRKLEREETLALEIENKKLAAENKQFKRALASRTFCQKCLLETYEGGKYINELIQLRYANDQLIEKLQYLRACAEIYEENPQIMMNYPSIIDHGASSTDGQQQINYQ